jgi:hypothetical protein
MAYNDIGPRSKGAQDRLEINGAKNIYPQEIHDRNAAEELISDFIPMESDYITSNSMSNGDGRTMVTVKEEQSILWVTNHSKTLGGSKVEPRKEGNDEQRTSERAIDKDLGPRAILNQSP